MNKPRLLRADEINCRVQSVTSNNSAVILLYKDARVDMAVLDETYGPMNWMREHTEIGGKLFCTISVFDKEIGWVSKQDVGVESNMDATKGEASDAFKRAGFNWGIGRELYTAPPIFVRLQDGEWETGNNGKKRTTFQFALTVKEIAYNDKEEIQTLVLVDRKGRERFTFGKNANASVPLKQDDAPQEKPEQDIRTERIKALCKHHNITSTVFNDYMKELKLSGKVPNKQTKDMTDQDFNVALSLVHTALNETRQPA